MKSTVTALAFAAAFLSVGCGRGHAIFNVDVYSFMVGTGKDTVPYAIAPNTTDSASTFQQIHLPPGFGSSIVESATIAGGADVRNTTGAGAIGFRMYIAADSAGTLDSATAFAFVGVSDATVTGPGVTPVIIAGGLTPAVLDRFTKEDVWIRIVARGRNTDLLNPVIGKMVLTSLMFRVVMQDNIL